MKKKTIQIFYDDWKKAKEYCAHHDMLLIDFFTEIIAEKMAKQEKEGKK